MTAFQPYPNLPDWPTTWPGCRVHGQMLNSLGRPIVGKMRFRMAPPFIQSMETMANGDRRTIYSTNIEQTLAADGSFDIVLPASDAPNSVPTGWTYHVTEVWAEGVEYDMLAPAGGDLDITDLRPVVSFAGNAPSRVVPNIALYDGGIG